MTTLLTRLSVNGWRHGLDVGPTRPKRASNSRPPRPSILSPADGMWLAQPAGRTRRSLSMRSLTTVLAASIVVGLSAFAHAGPNGYSPPAADAQAVELHKLNRDKKSHFTQDKQVW